MSFTLELNLEFFLICSLLLQFSLLYLNSFRVLSFLINFEFSILLLYLVFSFIFYSYENTFLLVFLAIFACEASVSLALLVGFVRLSDKTNVKSSSFSGL